MDKINMVVTGEVTLRAELSTILDTPLHPSSVNKQ